MGNVYQRLHDYISVSSAGLIKTGVEKGCHGMELLIKTRNWQFCKAIPA